MMKFKLLESIGSVDEGLLQECETAKYVHKSVVWKVMLVAAIIATLSITAVAAHIRFSDQFSEVKDVEIVPATFHIYMPRSEWELVRKRESAGYRLEADIETFADVPMKLLYPYLPEIPADWECTGATSAKYNGEIGVIGITWSYVENGQEYEVLYRQESAHFYNDRETPAIWWLDGLPADVTVTGQVTTIGDASFYQVMISGSETDSNFPSYGQRLIFWSDGYSIFLLQIPQDMPDSQVYGLMCSLTLQEDIETAISNLN